MKKTNINTVQAWSKEQVELIKRTVAKGASNDELALFGIVCQKTGLDPFTNQIHFVKRADKVTFQTGIDGYRAIADRTGTYAGSDDYRFDENLSEYEHIQTKRGYPTTATVTIYKIVSGIRVPFSATARWEEYYPGEKLGFMWKKMPYLMLSKCAEALALRKAFPNDLSNVYTFDEMQQDQVPIEAEKQPQKIQAEVLKKTQVPSELAIAEILDAKTEDELNNITQKYKHFWDNEEFVTAGKTRRAELEAETKEGKVDIKSEKLEKSETDLIAKIKKAKDIAFLEQIYSYNEPLMTRAVYEEYEKKYAELEIVEPRKGETK